MNIPKVYIETSVFNFYFLDKDVSKKEDTLLFFERVEKREFEPYTSNVVLKELRQSSDEKYLKMFSLVEKYAIKVIDSEIIDEELADKYIESGIIPKKYYTDALHLAITTTNKLNFVVSYNYGHIVKLKTLNLTGLVNVYNGYQQIGLFSPTEVKSYDGK
jgi:predicted nucleic acid-binding protein